MRNTAAFNKLYILCLSLAAMLAPGLADAQKDVSGIPIPMKRGILFYENVYTPDAAGNATDAAARDQAIYNKALSWFTRTFHNNHLSPATDQKKKIAGKKIEGAGDYALTNIDRQSPGSITRKETFIVHTGDDSKNYYYITVTMQVDIKDGGYTFQVYNFYEKPVQSGITNDYSKIEYRWWDFRQGKPWYNTDKALFTGLNGQVSGYIDSFRKEVAR